MGDWQGKTVELDVTNIAHGGICVARLDGRVVFVSDTIPGERVLARITEDSKKSFWRAETVEVIAPSEHRQHHVWAEASVDRRPEDRAGGAEFGHIELAHQRDLKSAVLTDSLSRMAKIDRNVAVEALPGDDRGTRWRTRVRLHVDDRGQIGPFAARSHRVIPVSSLPLATAEVEEVAPLDQYFAGEQSVDVLSPSGGSARLIVGTQKPSTIVEVVGDREFRLADGGFWQVHRFAASTLTRAVQDAIDPELFDPTAPNLDLYGGVGLLAAAVGDRFGPSTSITTVESDAVATEYAAANLVDWVDASAVTARVENWVRHLDAGADAVHRARMKAATVVLDPPRSGAGKDVVRHIAATMPAQVVYVACDPVALSRDIALFRAEGYALSSVRAFDLFPNTHHVEAIATLVRG
jgi:tRNA/tmRNA/rRNA uracil-C5-methylase (TrmA/RlmC/RlmD family)